MRFTDDRATPFAGRQATATHHANTIAAAGSDVRPLERHIHRNARAIRLAGVMRNSSARDAQRWAQRCRIDRLHG
jgi:hypothetical protein